MLAAQAVERVESFASTLGLLFETIVLRRDSLGGAAEKTQETRGSKIQLRYGFC